MNPIVRKFLSKPNTSCILRSRATTKLAQSTSENVWSAIVAQRGVPWAFRAVANSDQSEKRIGLGARSGLLSSAEIIGDGAADVLGLRKACPPRELFDSVFALEIEVDLFSFEPHIHHLHLHYTPQQSLRKGRGEPD